MILKLLEQLFFCLESASAQKFFLMCATELFLRKIAFTGSICSQKGGHYFITEMSSEYDLLRYLCTFVIDESFIFAFDTFVQ